MIWKIFRRWFNIAPSSSGWNCIQDDQGRKFWTTWGTHFERGPKLWVYHKGDWVGTVNATWVDDGGLELNDIVIFERFNYLREHGLGKKMMQCFIERAKSDGAKYIRGIIQAHEGSNNEYLVEWYQCQRFQVDGHLIYMDLQK